MFAIQSQSQQKSINSQKMTTTSSSTSVIRLLYVILCASWWWYFWIRFIPIKSCVGRINSIANHHTVSASTHQGSTIEANDLERDDGVHKEIQLDSKINDEKKLNLNKEEDDTVEINCPSRCRDNGTNSAQGFNHLQGNRIFYLLLIHNKQTANDAVHLFRSIRDPRNIILFHIDKKASDYLLPINNSDVTATNSDNNSEPILLWDEVKRCPCGMQIQIESIHSVEWGQWSMTVPTLWGIEVAVSSKYHGQWDVFINLSGDTIPVYTTNTMAMKLQEIEPYNFVTSKSCETGLVPTNVYTFPHWWHKRKHYTRDETEEDPIFEFSTKTSTSTTTVNNITIVTYFGSQWVILRPTFCLWLNEQLQDTDSWVSQFRDYLKQSKKLMTDETFIPSVLMHSKEFKHTIPQFVDDTEDSNYGRLILYSTAGSGTSNHTTDSHVTENKKLSSIYHVRYERMDEHTPSAFGKLPTKQRYDVPKSLQDTVSQPRAWGPYYLGVYDLGDIRSSGALFIRKASSSIDPNMVQLLPVDNVEDIPDIHWPQNEVLLIPKPDWNKRIEELKSNYLNTMQNQQHQQQGLDHEELQHDSDDNVTDDEEL